MQTALCTAVWRVCLCVYHSARVVWRLCSVCVCVYVCVLQQYLVCALRGVVLWSD